MEGVEEKLDGFKLDCCKTAAGWKRDSQKLVVAEKRLEIHALDVLYCSSYDRVAIINERGDCDEERYTSRVWRGHSKVRMWRDICYRFY